MPKTPPDARRRALLRLAAARRCNTSHSATPEAGPLECPLAALACRCDDRLVRAWLTRMSAAARERKALLASRPDPAEKGGA